MCGRLVVVVVLGCSQAGPVSPAQPDAAAQPDAPAQPALLPALPLATSSRWIVDANGARVKLVSVNWYGAESPDFVVGGLDRAPLAQIAATIHRLGFNSVRLPWSNELYETNPIVAADRLAANPDLVGKRALDIVDAVIDALAREGIVVVLDNHTSDAGWCCSTSDGNGLWYTARYPESAWLADWRGMATRYANVPAVIGADLRNELRAANGVSPTWGGGTAATDWRAAAQRAGDAIVALAPGWLVFVEGLSFSNDLTGVYNDPLALAAPGHLVYSPHDYAYDHPLLASYDQLNTTLGDNWGFILEQGKAFTAPVWIGELGTCHTGGACVSGTTGQGLWFASLRRYLANADIDWSYWAINGTESTGAMRTLGAEETYGLLDTTWTAQASPQLVDALAAIQPRTQGP